MTSISIETAIEEKLSKQLQGKRLICEASFSQDEIETWLETLIPERLNVWSIHPTLAAVATVGTGIYKYSGGDLWSAFSGLNSPIDQTRWGKRFMDFIESHESLESFQNLPGLKYVAPILAHGGVPQYCLPDFFTLLVRHGDPDQPSADFLDYIREYEASIVNIDKPVKRFLLHGGEVAEEFVARCLALWMSRESGDGGGTHGLPERVVKAFSEWYAENAPAQRTYLRQLPKPQIRINPGDLWVYLYLPRCDDHPEIGPSACWIIYCKEWAVTREHEIPIPLSDSWAIDCRGHKFILKGIDDTEPVMFFDPTTCKIIPNPSLRRLPDHLWAVFEQSLDVDPKPIYRESIPTWQNYVVAVLDLSGCQHVKIGEKRYEVRRPFFQVAKDPVVEGVITENDLPVFYEPPRIEWVGEANFSLIRHGQNEGNIDITSGDFQILFDRPGHYEFYLRGPFGQNVHKNFVMIPGLRLDIEPQVMWPDTLRLKCSIEAENVDIYTSAGRPSPFYSHVPSFRFKAFWGEMTMEMFANVPRLRWRVLMSSEETPEWNSQSITLSVKELEQSEYPRLVCEIGKIKKEVNVSLIAKHGTINSPQPHRYPAAFQQDVWAFDLRMVLDRVRQSGLAEEFDISVQIADGTVLYRGLVLVVQPVWNLQSFEAAWKKKSEGSVVCVSWGESGNVISGRWLILLPLWRPWEGVIQTHQLSKKERVLFEWRLLDIPPGRYIVRAVHAPWGCEDWSEAQFLKQNIIDIDMEHLAEKFDHNRQGEATIESYFEHLLAHWYRPQQVKNPPTTSSTLTLMQLDRFLKLLGQVDALSQLQIPRDNSGSLSIFFMNPQATTDAVASVEEFPDIWKKVLPSPEIISLEPTEKDKAFISEVAFQYTVLKTAAKAVKLIHKRKYLSTPLQEWHRDLTKKSPSPDEVIFLCEKFDLVPEGNKHAERREYEKLKSIFQRKEAV